MNILQIVSSSRTSGAEKHVIVLSERLLRRGHRVTTLCPPGGWLPAQLREAGVPVLEKKMHGAQFCTTALSLPRFVRDQQIDLIHTHLTCATYYGFLTGRVARLPVVSSVHVLTHDLVYRRLFPQRRNRIITVSDFVRDALLRQGIPASQVQTIYNGTEFCANSGENDVGKPSEMETLSEATSSRRGTNRRRGNAEEALPVCAELSLPPDAELVGLFGQVNEFKGHPILVRAIRRIVASRPRAYFVCVGPVEPHMQRMLWEAAAEDDVAERLRFTGVRNDVQRLMAAMDVIILPSLYEACSMSIIEAMAMGKPVIATRAGGNPELVQDHETGLLIERTPAALAGAIIAMLSDAGCRARMGEAARCRAESYFSANVMVDNIEALYHELVSLPQAP